MKLSTTEKVPEGTAARLSVPVMLAGVFAASGEAAVHEPDGSVEPGYVRDV